MSKPSYCWSYQTIREGLDEEFLIFRVLRHGYFVEVKVNPHSHSHRIFKIQHSKLGWILEIWLKIYISKTKTLNMSFFHPFNLTLKVLHFGLHFLRSSGVNFKWRFGTEGVGIARSIGFREGICFASVPNKWVKRSTSASKFSALYRMGWARERCLRC